jgi:hypothetical protein
MVDTSTVLRDDSAEDLLSAWCEQYLGAAPTGVLFRSDKISRVVGLRLNDGREVVVKSRPAEPRVATCFAVQRYAWERGFPCPEPLAGPAPLGELMATAERHVPGGEFLRGPDAPEAYGRWLAKLVKLVPADAVTGTLEPVPYWMDWDADRPRTWPPDPNVDLNASSAPHWLDEAADRVRRRLRDAATLPRAIGHADWECQNLRFRGVELHVAHDWDSAVRQPQAVVAGMSALMFPSTGTTNEAASTSESDGFLAAYQNERGRPFSEAERQVAWAAGLWIGAWKAKKALMFGDASVAERLRPEVSERLSRAAS